MTNNTKRGPDFIGIGMERAGTSWLFTQIAAHHEIWVPPLKELHYFDVIDPKALYLKHRYSYHLKSRIKQKAAPFLDTSKRPEFSKNSYLEYLAWDACFFIGAFNDDWYARLFDARFTKGRVAGEITPAYSNLTPVTIQRILDMNEDMKFLLMVRNPSARMWSGVIHHFRHIEKRDFDSVSEAEILDFLKNSAAQNRSDAASILETWQAHVPADQLLVQIFEDIAEKPDEILKNTYKFLGVDAAFRPPEALYKRKVNSYTKQSFEMPEAVQNFIEETCAPTIEALSKTHPEIVKRWES